MLFILDTFFLKVSEKTFSLSSCTLYICWSCVREYYALVKFITFLQLNRISIAKISENLRNSFRTKCQIVQFTGFCGKFSLNCGQKLNFLIIFISAKEGGKKYFFLLLLYRCCNVLFPIVSVLVGEGVIY